MYHSVIIGSKNTFSDWHLVPASRPVIAMPAIRTNYIDVPGMNGVLDLTEALTKYPTYENREGTLDFHVLNDHENWKDIYHKIAKYLHGQRRTLKLEDDPDFYYEGRFSIERWESNNNGTWSDVSINYYLDPYKYYKKLSTEENASLYSNISVNSSSVTKNFGGTGTIGDMPVVPTIVASSVGNTGVTITFTNSELGISNLSKTISSNGTRKFYDMVFSDLSGSNTCKLVVNGIGTISISFRRGEL